MSNKIKTLATDTRTHRAIKVMAAERDVPIGKLIADIVRQYAEAEPPKNPNSNDNSVQGVGGA